MSENAVRRNSNQVLTSGEKGFIRPHWTYADTFYFVLYYLAQRFYYQFGLRNPVTLQTNDFYNVLVFKDVNDIDYLISQIVNLGPSSYSQWYGRIETVQSINFDLKISKILKQIKQQDFQYVAILPCQICPKSNSIIAVREELMYALWDLKDLVENKPEWFQTIPFVSKDGKKSKIRDIEQATDHYIPCVFTSLRLVELSDDKIRSFGLHCLLSNAINTAFQLKNNTDKIALVMREDEAQQMGLFSICNENNCDQWPTATLPFVKLTIGVDVLKEYLNKLKSIDGIIVDILIHLNESILLPDRSRKLNFEKVYDTQKHIYKNRCITPDHLALLIHASDEDEQTLDKFEVNKAVNYIMYLLNDYGYSLEIPLKMVNESLSTFHVFQTNSERDKHLKIYKPYLRKVRKVSPSGYRVKIFSLWIWMTLTIGIIIPIVYFIVRIRQDASLEDVISTATALIGLYIAIISPIVLQLFYRGEDLIDVFRNIRQVDSQEEFTDRGSNQIPDIIQVLRLAKTSPSFLGGSNNTSYINNNRPSNGFDAKAPMPFQNLQVIGFSLYEDQFGNMFMVDPWNNLFQVLVLDSSKPFQLDRVRPRNNFYMEEILYEQNDDNRELNLGMVDNSLNNLTLYCKVLRLVQPIEKWRISGNFGEQNPNFKLNSSDPVDPDDSYSHLSSTQTPHPNTGCFIARYKSLEEEKTVIISRVLPFGSRLRQVGIAKERSIRFENSWRRINNADLLRMDVGLRKKLVSG